MKSPMEKRTELSVKKADMAAMKILMSCINTALVLVGLAFVIIKLTANDRVDAYAIVLFCLAALIAIIGICAMAMYKSAISSAVDDNSEHI